MQNFEQLPNRCYRYKWRPTNSSVDPKPSTFFPKEWSRAKVIEKVSEAYRNGIKEFPKAELLDSNSPITLKGLSKEGISIEMILKKQGRSIIVRSYYPE